MKNKNQTDCSVADMKCLEALVDAGDRLGEDKLCLRCRFNIRFNALAEMVQRPHPAVSEKQLVAHARLIDEALPDGWEDREGDPVGWLVDVEDWIERARHVLNESARVMLTYEYHVQGAEWS